MTSDIRILHIVPRLEVGGIGMMLLNYYKEIYKKSAYIFDFIVHGDEIGELEEVFLSMGSKIYHVCPKQVSYKKYTEDVKKVFRENEYKIVHAHQNNRAFIPLKIAKKMGIKIRIAHAHSCLLNPNFKEKVDRVISMNLNKIYSTNLAFCSLASRDWVFGKRSSGTLILNGINIDKYIFDSDEQKTIREELHINNKIVLGYIGRLDVEKNISFLIDIMSHLSIKYHLIVIGNGPLEVQLKEITKEKGLEHNITFLGSKMDAYRYYNAFDYFLLPSLFEAFPVTLIEAQTNGVVSFVSENIPDDVIVTQLIKKISNYNVNSWIQQIENAKLNKDRRMPIEMNNFSTEVLGNDLIKYYDSLLQIYGE